MPLLNYTTEIDTDKSINEIQKALSKVGAMKVMIDFDEGTISALSFALKVNDQILGFRLPCDWRPVYKALHGKKRPYPEYDKRSTHQKSEWKLQAVRTAWRIVKDWVEAQCALIETHMVQTEQVFLPYMMVGPDQTLYQKMADRQFLLGEGK